MKKTLPNRFRWLITIDLDGTLLKTGSTHNKFKIHEKNISVLKTLIKHGHKVAIVTGRPWNDTEEIYRALGLTTIVANYNGAMINDPNDPGFVKMSTTINRKILFDVLNDNFIKKRVKNIIIEDDKNPWILNSKDEFLKKQFHVIHNPLLREFKTINDISINPYSAILFLNHKDITTAEVLQYLKRKYGAGLTFRYWPGKKGEYFLEINTASINKAIAMKKIASFYNIPLYRTIAFGDGLNDIEMLSEVAFGVAMKNATDTVKMYGKDVTDYTNDEGGVGRYLEKFFKYDNNWMKEEK